jgi:Uncharacterized conserved protein (DUF2190)
MSHNPILTKTYTAGGTIAARTIVKFGAADFAVVAAAAAADLAVGVSDVLAVVAGERVDIHVSGLADVVYGGAVTRGQALTSDAQGRAIAASNAGEICIGFAEVSGVANDIGSVAISRHKF